MAKSALAQIQQKITSIQNGLLKVSSTGNKESIHVRVVADKDDKICCTMMKSSTGEVKDLSKQRITLVHKHNSHYLFVAGKVLRQVSINKMAILSIRILKAGWFEKQTKGNVSWLNEMHSYTGSGNIAGSVS